VAFHSLREALEVVRTAAAEAGLDRIAVELVNIHCPPGETPSPLPARSAREAARQVLPRTRSPRPEGHRRDGQRDIS
jgi:hypothetical protein